MKSLSLLLVAFALLSSTYSQTLFPGMQAPSLHVSTWVKGKPVTNFHKDSTYVVEFWATWCGPCKQSIPHLTELARKYPQINIIGVSIAEANTKNVDPFVQKMGEKMDYTVAIDQQESDTAREGFMSKNWMEAAGLNGIPVAFVINKNEVAWIGYPMQLDSILETINNGTWDSKKFAKKWKKDKEEEKAFSTRMTQYKEKVNAHARDGERKQFYKALDEQLKFITGNSAQADWPQVNEHIWYWIADPAGKALTPEMKDYSFGIKWMEKLTSTPEGKNPAFFDTLAWCYHGAGEKQKAIETETKALEMLPVNTPGREEYEKSLQTFQQ